ncbi:MAG: dinitrogenase iron-molybdenum cofactor biosynthesis protein [Deltaproteobacteria bacterium]|nr:MAG: dinitrogenase iron-molybdenum cofactor biosynthesis protein [Deltaproteobacteria bacterium]
MKIVLSASGPDLEAQVEPRFGRAPYFLMVDTETMACEALTNGQNLQAAQGAGIQAAAMITRQRPAAVLTGHCGPKAFNTLLAAGIGVILGMKGPVREAVQKYQAGKLAPARVPDVASHWMS